MPRIWFLICNRGTTVIFPPISLVVFEKILQVLFGDERKSTSGGCFSVLVILILSPYGQI